jgi:hypothetical protein
MQKIILAVKGGAKVGIRQKRLNHFLREIRGYEKD